VKAGEYLRTLPQVDSRRIGNLRRLLRQPPHRPRTSSRLTTVRRRSRHPRRPQLECRSSPIPSGKSPRKTISDPEPSLYLVVAVNTVLSTQHSVLSTQNLRCPLQPNHRPVPMPGKSRRPFRGTRNPGRHRPLPEAREFVKGQRGSSPPSF
jgi:hypothetical protein